jgi:hypothetical protein
MPTYSDAHLDYCAERYVRLSLYRRGITFAGYLAAPGFYEHLAQVHAPLLRDEHGIRGPVADPGETLSAFGQDNAKRRCAAWLRARVRLHMEDNPRALTGARIAHVLRLGGPPVRRALDQLIARGDIARAGTAADGAPVYRLVGIGRCEWCGRVSHRLIAGECPACARLSAGQAAPAGHSDPAPRGPAHGRI